MKLSNKVLMSAELSSKPFIENLERTLHLKQILEDRNEAFKQVLGCYKGVREASFMIERPKDLNDLIKIARDGFGQESILVTDSKGIATLLMLQTETAIKLGPVKRVRKEYAKTLEAWTLINGEYWVVSND